MIWAGKIDAVEIGFAAGLMGSRGHKHRLVLDLMFSPAGTQVLRLHGLRVDSHIIYGFGLAIGYEYMTFSGVTFRRSYRVCLGLRYRVFYQSPYLAAYLRTNPDRAGIVRNAADSTWTSYRSNIGLDPTSEPKKNREYIVLSAT